MFGRVRSAIVVFSLATITACAAPVSPPSLIRSSVFSDVQTDRCEVVRDENGVLNIGIPRKREGVETDRVTFCETM